MIKIKGLNVFLVFFVLVTIYACKQEPVREKIDFDQKWLFSLGDDSLAMNYNYDDSNWRKLNLPHDWSIEGEFSNDNPSKTDGGALPTGIGWYRKTFDVCNADLLKQVYIEFDGVYRNSEVWINGHYLGKRPFGYISFEYNLTPYLKIGNNVIAVKVDNSLQPNSRWYTGSGIYRHVWLKKMNTIHIKHWGTFITTSVLSEEIAKVKLDVSIKNSDSKNSKLRIVTVIKNKQGEDVTKEESDVVETNDSSIKISQYFDVEKPFLWSPENPYLYSVVTSVYDKDKLVDTYETPLGIRYFKFDAKKGFLLNGKPVKLNGVCLHHDLGALGAAVNTAAMKYRLKILKDMGCNAIRMAHNPPAPELLDLCDQMGFIVQDEAFDVWKKKKMKYDYNIDWDTEHVRDLQDMVLRDRNHPSVMMWSIGNEIREQFDSTGIFITKKLVAIVKGLDTTRPVTSALTENNPAKNFIIQSDALDLIGFNYKQEFYEKFQEVYTGKTFHASETMCAEATRGFYQMPSDSIMRWPTAYNEPLIGANDECMVSAYDHVSAYWGSTHEETWKLVKKFDFVSGMFVWTGFDYLGEPTPYPWPARSSYFGIIDLAGFPKDSYYMYQSEWTNKPVLHLFPHWNWKEGQIIDVWAYYNNADEVELFVNGESKGVKTKNDSIFHVMWRVIYHPGSVKAVSRKGGKIVLVKEIFTAADASKISLSSNKFEMMKDGKDMAFVTVDVIDDKGSLVPNADNMIHFEVIGGGFIAGVDNGYQASMEPFKTNYRKAFHGKCMVMIQSNGKAEDIVMKATSNSLQSSEIKIKTK
ncbi:MAG: DUF4982 domain-containing protein [Marinilabiliaceae bacterium]|nr:DUF4982 domain-containing protein [Marinilabiliaceae bacterium]